MKPQSLQTLVETPEGGRKTSTVDVETHKCPAETTKCQAETVEVHTERPSCQVET